MPDPSMTQSAPKPDDWLWPQFDPDCCVLDDDGNLGEVSSAEHYTRSQAITRAKREWGVQRNEIVCRVCWIRPRTRQDEWDDHAADEAAWAWCDENGLKWADGAWRDDSGTAFHCPVPDEPPADWSHGNPDAVWTHAKPGEKDAVKVYICEMVT